MKKLPILALVAMFLVLAATSCKRTRIDEQIAREAVEFTKKQCPMVTDTCTRLDSTVYDISTRTYYYNHTLFGLLDDDGLYDEKFRDAFHDEILQKIRSSIPLRTQKSLGIVFVYRYYSQRDGHLIMDYRFTKEDYK